MFKSRNASVSQRLKHIIWPKKGFQRSFIYLKERISRMRASTHALSLGLACGAAASMTPFIGFHFLLAALLAFLFRANMFASALGTIIGNPWSFPFIWAANHFVGNFVIDSFGIAPWLAEVAKQTGDDVPVTFIYTITLGGVVLAVVTFPIFYGLSYFGLHSWRTHRQKKRDEKRSAATVQQARQEPVAPMMGDKPQTERGLSQ